MHMDTHTQCCPIEHNSIGSPLIGADSHSPQLHENVPLAKAYMYSSLVPRLHSPAFYRNVRGSGVWERGYMYRMGLAKAAFTSLTLI